VVYDTGGDVNELAVILPVGATLSSSPMTTSPVSEWPSGITRRDFYRATDISFETLGRSIGVRIPLHATLFFAPTRIFLARGTCHVQELSNGA